MNKNKKINDYIAIRKTLGGTHHMMEHYKSLANDSTDTIELPTYITQIFTPLSGDCDILPEDLIADACIDYIDNVLNNYTENQQ